MMSSEQSISARHQAKILAVEEQTRRAVHSAALGRELEGVERRLVAGKTRVANLDSAVKTAGRPDRPDLEIELATAVREVDYLEARAKLIESEIKRAR